MIAENFKRIKARINEKCSEISRNPAEIKLIAVSKNFGVSEILEANQAGSLDFGENRAQELKSKFEELGNKVTWHFIGNLQRNKVKYVVGCAEYIHSMDSYLLASEIEKRAAKNNIVQKVLLQFKTSEEESKSGLTDLNEAKEILELCGKSPYLELKGLMTIAALTEDKSLIKESFSYLRRLKDEYNSQGYKLSELSMGMTSDFEIAIEEGATMLRVGSAIFGVRDYNKQWKDS
ncbi:MAG: YggS family pyridoxal phosphate-dependent enzyme [Ignavibacteriales bacterium]|nr:MAG: YggS family pyridoxal phosphate-dependent enzyme [Ignavibacteriales bacterium]